ncbi:hypothetical protein HWI79_1179 [Cryptosporidium felis]|nr:hypothetical protein HWI79_1179 [Cryptosporidium felis]
MWQNISSHTFATSCLHRIDDCFSHDSSTTSPKLLHSGMIQNDLPSNLRTQSSISPRNLAFQTAREMDSQSASIEHERLHNTYKSFLNMDRVMPWMSNVDLFPFSGNSPQQSNAIIDLQNHQNLPYFQSLQSSQNHSSHNSTILHQNSPLFQSSDQSEESKYFDRINLFPDQHSHMGMSGVFNTSPVKSDASTATPTSMRSIINDNFFSYQDERKLNIGYFSSGINNGVLSCVNTSNLSTGVTGCSGNNIDYFHINNNGVMGNTTNLSFVGVEHYRLGDVPPLSFSCFDKNRNEAYCAQASNLLKILSPSWILCIDIAAILLTNTDNKMALSNIGPKLSCFARDALRQIKQKKLSRFIKEHGNFFDIRRPSPTHSALYVTLKFPLPSVIQQFLPSIVQLRKYESERNQINNRMRTMNEFSESNIESSKGSNFEKTETTPEVLQSVATSRSGKLDLVSEKKESGELQGEQKLENDSNETIENDDSQDNVPSSVDSYQAYECWLCVREFANVIVSQPTHTMELREIGVLMSQKAKIQAKRNSSKKNYKSFLLSYPKLFRIFGKDDNHSIQWIGSNQDFVKLNSIKYQPSQSEDELLNVTSFNQSHSQFLFSLNGQVPLA